SSTKSRAPSPCIGRGARATRSRRAARAGRRASGGRRSPQKCIGAACFRCHHPAVCLLWFFVGGILAGGFALWVTKYNAIRGFAEPAVTGGVFVGIGLTCVV